MNLEKEYSIRFFHNKKEIYHISSYSIPQIDSIVKFIIARDNPIDKSNPITIKKIYKVNNVIYKYFKHESCYGNEDTNKYFSASMEVDVILTDFEYWKD